MARTTGPILAIGGITVANQVIFNEEDMDWRVPIATGIAAMLFSLAERGWEKGAVSLAYLALLTSLIARIGGRPSPIESAAAWWGRGPAEPGKGIGGGGNTGRYRPA
ncbi:hypothetical protein E1265_21345 [Streptomyces sp. 8K308]|uniref:hypothetical protein n=1 Tax=Streptomyces sp. 8K308 TaxID=2530388 RepID=UPI0010434C6D|nr:hypothetical protein [Streptomyces sp. 8K308]TDC20618.1 hypothetical protein E1265_21345 [Streptomyces sp. 8K308]